jgi:hypothetical protein
MEVRIIKDRKEAVEKYASELLFSSRSFAVVRDAYQRLFDGEKFELRERTLALFSEFISPGDLVLSRIAQLAMRVCSDTGLSTFSNEWFETVRTSPLHTDARWLATIDVRVTTLDSLAKLPNTVFQLSSKLT